MASWDPGRVSFSSRFHALMRLVRIEHTLFSLPFAYVGLFLSGYSFGWREVLLVFLAVLGLRTAGMSFNNIADLDIDRLNPRSMNRPLVKGVVRLRDAWLLVVVGSLLYFVSAFLLNWYAFLLSPVLWIIALSYPYAKRMHWLPHIHLGLTLGLVVFGGAIAASGDEVDSIVLALESVPWIYVIGVTFWVAGFDVFYSIMDIEFDRRQGLGSVPARLGVRGSLYTSLFFHLISIGSFFIGWFMYGLGLIGFLSILSASVLLLYENYIVWRDLSRIPVAFNINLVIGLIVSIGVIIDLLLGKFY